MVVILSVLGWIVLGIIGVIVGILILGKLLGLIWALISDFSGIIWALIVFIAIIFIARGCH